MAVEQRKPIDLREALDGLRAIFDELQANPRTHDDWDWIDAYFYLEVIKTLTDAEGREHRYKFLLPEFLDVMNDIGSYGFHKYKRNSFQWRQTQGDRTRGIARCEPEEIAKHAAEHFQMYLRGELHDNFGTRKHQLAAVAFNAMMEFYFAGPEE